MLIRWTIGLLKHRHWNTSTSAFSHTRVPAAVRSSQQLDHLPKRLGRANCSRLNIGIRSPGPGGSSRESTRREWQQFLADGQRKAGLPEE